MIPGFICAGLAFCSGDAIAVQFDGEPAPSLASPVLILRGLNKISGQSIDIVAPVGKTVRFATLAIIARYCYSTPLSETPETVAFLQIDDRRPGQSERRIFSGWMYASSPSLNALDHPLYDVGVVACRTAAPGETPGPVASSGPPGVHPPDSTDKEKSMSLPSDAGQ